MIIMTYYCKHCDRNFFKRIPVCEMNKETTECKYCGKTAKLSPDSHWLENVGRYKMGFEMLDATVWEVPMR